MKIYLNPKNGIHFIKYENNDLIPFVEMNIGITQAFFQKGLPFLPDDYAFRFFPLSSPKIINLKNNLFLTLGNIYRNPSSLEDNIIMLNFVDLGIYFYSQSLYEVQLVPHEISIVNTSIDNFVSFCIEVTSFSREVFNNEKSLTLPFDKVKIKLKKLIDHLHTLDSRGLGLDSDHRLLWRSVLNNLQFSIQEKYEKTFSQSELYP